MLPESIATLNKHKHFYDFYIKTRELVNFYPHIQLELLNVYRTEVDPYYHYNKNCGECVKNFLTLIYKWYAKIST